MPNLPRMTPLMLFAVPIAAALSGMAMAASAPSADTPQAQYNPKELQIDQARSNVAVQPEAGSVQTTDAGRKPDAPAAFMLDVEGQPAGIKSPRDPASGQSGNTRTADGYLKIEGIDGESAVSPASSAQGSATTGNVREGGANDTTFRRKPPRNRAGARGKRKHQP